MAKPVLRYKVNQQSAEVGGKYYGIIEDTPVTPENSILQICEFKKITAFTPEQVLRLVEDVCDGAAKLVARDGQSRQISSLLKFSPRVRGTFAATDSRWTDQRLIVGARLLKDIKLEMTPSDFVMSNVADIGTLSTAALQSNSVDIFDLTAGIGMGHPTSIRIAVNGAKLQTWDANNTSAQLAFLVNGGSEWLMPTAAMDLTDFAPNGFSVVRPLTFEGSVRDFLTEELGVSVSTIDDIRLVVYHPDLSVEFKRLPIQR